MPASFLIRNARLIDLGHQHHNQQIDIAIVDGRIENIGPNIKGEFETIVEGKDIVVSSGWTDLRCHLPDPGMEYRDTLSNLQDCAALGGFTAITTLPNSQPPIADKASVLYVLNSTKSHSVSVLPTGQLADRDNSENLAELYDMHAAGALAFTSGDCSVSNGLLKKGLLYSSPFKGLIITHPSDKSLENGGLVNESSNTVHTGLKTNPAIAEYLNLKEQIEVARYCDSKIHFSCISTLESVQMIRSAKKEGLEITCDVSIFNLCFTDNEVLGFDENFKLYPPLRSKEDRQALIEGVNDGTIDAICTNHTPHNIEGKVMEFDYAEFGALGLQQTLPWFVKYLSDDITVDRFVECLTTGPHMVLGLGKSEIATGQKANLSVFSLTEEWTFDKSTNGSLSKNSHEWNRVQKGKVLAVIANNKAELNN